MAKRQRSRASPHIFRQRDFGWRGINMFGRYQYAASRKGLDPHSHRNAIEICFLERGEQTYRVNGRIYRLRGNDQFFTLPGEVHDTAELPQERGILYWLILETGSSGSFLGLDTVSAALLRRELLQMPARHFQADPASGGLLTQIFELLGARQHDDRTSALKRLRLQSLVLLYLSQTIQAARRGAQGAASPLMHRVLDYIEDRMDEPVHVPILARVAELSESRLKARFKKELGIPPAEFWLRRKVDRAAEMLKRQSVTEVAHHLGFSSSQYFATVFKRYTMKRPSEYRLG